MIDLPTQVERAILDRQLLRDGQSVVLAVSGGVDSMVLLHVLNALSLRHSWQLCVAHLNHRLRGRSSDADERLVLRTAKELSLPAVSERIDVARLARKEKLSIEMAARRARHEFLARAAAKVRARTVALAHHADDQVELFFLRLLRGAGIDGLAGMKWRNPSPANGQVDLVRPLLGLTKEALLEYAAEHHLRFREDASNRSLDIQRNRIRHELLPLLRQKYQAALNRVIGRLMDLAGAEAEVTAAAAAEWLRTSTDRRFGDLPVAIQRRIVQLQLARQGVLGDYDLVERLRAGEKPTIKAPGQTVWLDDKGCVHSGDAVISGTGPRPPGIGRRLRVRLNLANGKPRRLSFSGVEIRCHSSGISSRTGEVKRVVGSEVFDADQVGGTVVLRHWHPGDRFHPIGMKAPVKLQDMFVNLKIPRARRHELVVATTAAGEVFWVEDLRISDRFKITRRTIRRLHWQWKRL